MLTGRVVLPIIRAGRCLTRGARPTARLCTGEEAGRQAGGSRWKVSDAISTDRHPSAWCSFLITIILLNVIKMPQQQQQRSIDPS